MCDTSSVGGQASARTDVTGRGRDGSIFSPNKLGRARPKPQKKRKPYVVDENLVSKAAAQKEREIALKKKGRASTILAGGLTEEPTLSRPQALGY